MKTRSELAFLGCYLGRKIARASNSTGWGSDMDLKTGQPIWHAPEEGQESGEPRPYASAATAVSAAKRWVLGWEGRYDLLVFQVVEDPHRPEHTVRRFAGYAVWDGCGCAKGGTV